MDSLIKTTVLCYLFIFLEIFLDFEIDKKETNSQFDKCVMDGFMYTRIYTKRVLTAVVSFPFFLRNYWRFCFFEYRTSHIYSDIYIIHIYHFFCEYDKFRNFELVFPKLIQNIEGSKLLVKFVNGLNRIKRKEIGAFYPFSLKNIKAVITSLI